MNLHQFRFVQEAARQGLNLTEAAKALHTSQPGVSKAIMNSRKSWASTSLPATAITDCP